MRTFLTKLTNEDIFFYTSLVLLISFPLSYAISSIAIGLFVIVNLVVGLKNKNGSANKVYLLFIAIYLLGGLSMLWTFYPESTLKALWRELPMALIPLALLFSPRISNIQFYKLWKYIGIFQAILFFVLLSVALVRYFESGLTSIFFYHEFTSPLDVNAIFMSFYVAIAFLVLIGQIKNRSSIELVIASILFVFILLLSSKIIIACTLIGVLIQFIRNKRHIKFIFPLIALVFVAILLIKPLRDRFISEKASNFHEVLVKDEFGKIYPWTGSTIRVLQMRVGIEILKKENRFIQGVGFGASQQFIKENQAEKNMYFEYGNYNFHNQYFQFLVELGIIGLVLYFIIILNLFSDFRTNAMAISIIFLIMSLGFTESFLWRQRGLMLCLIVIGLLYQSKNRFEIKDNL